MSPTGCDPDWDEKTYCECGAFPPDVTDADFQAYAKRAHDAEDALRRIASTGLPTGARRIAREQLAQK